MRSPTEGDRRKFAPATRIASLLASATEIACALGLGDQLVGISHECDYPAEALGKPRLSRARFDPTHLTSGAIDAAVRRAIREHGSVYEVDAERLAGLRPARVPSVQVAQVLSAGKPPLLANRSPVSYPRQWKFLPPWRAAGVVASPLS